MIDPRRTFCFTCTQGDGHPFARLILAQKDPQTFAVSNVIPVSKHQLAHGEYNAVVEDFYERVIRPSTSTTGMTCISTEARAELEHWMSAETAKRFRQFLASREQEHGFRPPQ